MNLVSNLNLALRFFLEICMLTAFGYWGFHLERSMFIRTIVGVGAPLVAALVWGIFLAPKAMIKIDS